MGDKHDVENLWQSNDIIALLYNIGGCLLVVLLKDELTLKHDGTKLTDVIGNFGVSFYFQLAVATDSDVKGSYLGIDDHPDVCHELPLQRFLSDEHIIAFIFYFVYQFYSLAEAHMVCCQDMADRLKGRRASRLQLMCCRRHSVCTSSYT